MIKPLKKAADMSVQELARYIDYSVLKPEFTEDEIIKLTKDGVRLECATICINPAYIPLCEKEIIGTNTSLCPVIDFPFGSSSTSSRIQQIASVADFESVKEIDIVANFGLIRSGKFTSILEDLKQCVQIVHAKNKELKVIFETDALTKTEITQTCKCCIEANVDFVKTSTGFYQGRKSDDWKADGATVEIIELIMSIVNGKCKIKGSGGIRTREHFLQLIDKGIDRMGIGYASVPIVLNQGKKESNDFY
ncbi:MAG: deoxyribose-phosphate aldolase [Treponemataceae bacterium]